MIEFFSKWAEQIIIAVVISSIIEMILPDNKNKKYIKMVMGIYILFNIISPIIDKKDLFSLDSLNLESYAASSSDVQEQKVNQDSMDERLQQLYIEELENNIKTKVQQEGYSVSSCKVDAVLTGNESSQGINKISLVVKKKNDSLGDNTSTSNKSDIRSVNRVEVNVGLDKFFGKDEDNLQDDTSNSEIQSLKNTLSSYYEIDSSKIFVTIKQ